MFAPELERRVSHSLGRTLRLGADELSRRTTGFGLQADSRRPFPHPISAAFEREFTGKETAMDNNAPTRVAVVGLGNVGATLGYALLLSGLAAEIVLIDKNHAKAERAIGGACTRSSSRPATPLITSLPASRRHTTR